MVNSLDINTNSMKVIIFAGGHGTRLWPLSKKNSPKQFEQVFEGKSTLQLAVERIKDIVPYEDIYISTNKTYKELIKAQIPEIPDNNYILEPVRRDLAPAVGLSFFKLKEQNYKGPVAILWADHLMERPEEFRKALVTASELIESNPSRFIYLGERPRFANHNLGWITVGKKTGDKNGLDILEFKSWAYRPKLELCKQLLNNGDSYWNPGYFITSVDFVLSLYKSLLPEMYKTLEIISQDKSKLESLYQQLEAISFDDAIIEKTKPDQAVVLRVDLGWSDPGTLYALKEALESSHESNVTQGNAIDFGSTDCLIINKENKKLLTTIDLTGMVVINTEDVILVVHKDNVPKVKEAVKELEGKGLDKYI